MAGILDWIDQNLGTRLGLLVNDPRAAMEQMNRQAGAYNQASLLAVQAERNALRGLPVTPEQAAAKQYVDKSLEDVAMGFAGTTSPRDKALKAIREMEAARPKTDLSWVNNPITAEPSRITNAPSLDQIMQNARNSNVKLDISENNGVINLSRIVVPKEQRGSGVGSGIMKQLVDYADATGARITLSPSTDFGATSVSRLKDFYKQFGFVENKGRNKDFSTRETMYRESMK